MTHDNRRDALYHAFMRCLVVTVILLLLVGCSSRPLVPLVPQEGAPPDSVVAASLERAITMGEILHLYGWARAIWMANLELIEDLQPTLVGRAALVWGWEHIMLRGLSGLRYRVQAVHDVAPEAQSLLSAILAAGAYTPEGATEPEPLACRVIAGLAEEPDVAIAAGRLDPALHLQVSVLPLHIPPLRERKEDIPYLLELFMRDHGDEPALLALLEELLGRTNSLVSFNGRSFDVPLLDNRFLMNRMRTDIRDKPHIDLLPPSRRLWRQRLQRSWRIPGFEPISLHQTEACHANT